MNSIAQPAARVGGVLGTVGAVGVADSGLAVYIIQHRHADGTSHGSTGPRAVARGRADPQTVGRAQRQAVTLHHPPGRSLGGAGAHD